MLTHKDQKLIWHPFTQEKVAPDVVAIERGKGAYLYDYQGKAYLDLISSWWVNLHGHGHPVIAERIYQQARRLEHVMFAGFTHEPAVHLCEMLCNILPPQLNRFFFSDNGSTATEVAIKMAYQFWKNQGESQRSHFLSFQGGYHGDTVGAMSVSMSSGFHTLFAPLCFGVETLPYPDTWDEDTEVDIKEERALHALEEILASKASQIAAIILEPMIQGASGMRIVRPHFIQACVRKVRAYGILVIFDEVMTGFCRTGRYFALEHTDVVPDFLCLSKGITGGFLPLALTIMHPRIYDAFLHEEWRYAFAHGHSYTANPIACAAAIASLELLILPECQERISALKNAQHEGILALKERHPFLLKLRSLGTISAFDIPEEYSVPHFKQRCFEAGLLVRPLSNTVYFLPPYVTTPEELHSAFETCSNIIQQL